MNSRERLRRCMFFVVVVAEAIENLKNKFKDYFQVMKQKRSIINYPNVNL